MKKLLLVLFTVVFSTGITLADDATFDWSGETTTQSNLKSDNIFTSTPITLTFSKGSNSYGNIPAINKEGSIRMYVNTTLTIKADDGYQITGVTFTPTGTSYNATKLTYDGTAISDSWTLDTPAQEVLLTATANARFKKIIVSYTTTGGVVKKSADLAFSETDFDLESGVDEFTAPTFTKATTATVTFASDNESVAKVSADGVISLAGGLGTAVITATAAENDDYYAGTATCTVEVAEYNHYVKATTVESGKAYLIGAVLTDGTAFYAYPVGTSSTHGYLSGSTSKSADDIRVKKSYDDTFVFTSETDGWTIKQNTDSRYLYQTGTYNSFNVDAAPTSGQYWTVSANSDGTQTITNTAVSKYIQYSPSYKSFGSYSSAQTNAILPTLYILKDTATGINGVAVDSNVVEQNDAVYNISGQRVSKSYKGLVIKNGKKYIQK